MDALQVLLRAPRHTESTKVAEHLRGAHRHLETGGSVAQLDAILQKNQIQCKMAAKGDGARPNYLPHVDQAHVTKRLHHTLAFLHLDQAGHTPPSLAASDPPFGAQLDGLRSDFVGYLMYQRRHVAAHLQLLLEIKDFDDLRFSVRYRSFGLLSLVVFLWCH